MRLLLLILTLAAAAAAQTTGRINVIPNAADTATGEIRFEEKRANGTNYFALSAPDMLTATVRMRLPSDAGRPGYCLTTDGWGALNFANCGEVKSTDYRWTRYISPPGGELSDAVYSDLSSPGSNKVATFNACPAGLAKGVEIRIYDGTGTPETVRVKNTTCLVPGFGSIGTAGEVSFDTTQSHSGNFMLASATAGIAEAAADASLGFRSPAHVRVPAGHHTIHGTVYVPEGGAGPAKGIVIRGDGQATTIVEQTVPQSAFVFDYGQWNEVRSLKITFTDAITSAHTNVWAVEMRGQGGPRVEDVYLEWAPNGILLTDSNLPLRTDKLYRNVFPTASAQVHNITVRSVLTGGVGIRITSTYPIDPTDPLTGIGDSQPATTARDGGDDYFLTGLSMYGVPLRDSGPVQRPSACIEIRAGGGVNITGKNAIANCDQGLLINPSNYQNVRWTFVSDTALDTGGYGLVLHPTTGGSIKSFAAGSNFWVATNSEDGIITLGAGEGGTIDGVSIGTGSRIANNGGYGINHLYGDNFHAEGVHVCGNSAAAFGHGGERDGIFVGGGVSDFSFTDVVSGNCDSFVSASQRYGVHVASGTSDRYEISGQFRGNLLGSIIDGGTGRTKSVGGVRFEENSLAPYVAANTLDFGYGAPKFLRIAGPTPIQYLGANGDGVWTPLAAGHTLYIRFGDPNPGGFITGGNVVNALKPQQNALVTCVMQIDNYWSCSSVTEHVPALHIETPAGSAPTNSFHIWDRDKKHVLVMGTRAGDVPDRVQIGFFDTGPTNAAGTVTYTENDNRRWKEVYMPGRLQTWEFSAARGDFFPGNGYDGVRVFDSDQANYIALVPVDANKGSIGWWKSASTSFGRLVLQGVVETANLEILATDGANEGGNIFLHGAGGNPGWTIDLYGNELRLFTTSSGSGHAVSIYDGSAGGVLLNVVGPIVGSSTLDISGNAQVGSLTSIGLLSTTGGFSCSGSGCPAIPGGPAFTTVTVRNGADTTSCTITFNSWGVRVGGTC